MKNVKALLLLPLQQSPFQSAIKRDKTLESIVFYHHKLLIQKSQISAILTYLLQATS